MSSLKFQPFNIFNSSPTQPKLPINLTSIILSKFDWLEPVKGLLVTAAPSLLASTPQLIVYLVD